MPQEFTLNEVARLTGIPYYRIYYGHYTGRIPEPKRVGRNRIYTDRDVRRIKEHFARKEAAGIAQDSCRSSKLLFRRGKCGRGEVCRVRHAAWMSIEDPPG